jgi:hypothetical protein
MFGKGKASNAAASSSRKPEMESSGGRARSADRLIASTEETEEPVTLESLQRIMIQGSREIRRDMFALRSNMSLMRNEFAEFRSKIEHTASSQMTIAQAELQSQIKEEKERILWHLEQVNKGVDDDDVDAELPSKGIASGSNINPESPSKDSAHEEFEETPYCAEVMEGINGEKFVENFSPVAVNGALGGEEQLRFESVDTSTRVTRACAEKDGAMVGCSTLRSLLTLVCLDSVTYTASCMYTKQVWKPPWVATAMAVARVCYA